MRVLVTYLVLPHVAAVERLDGLEPFEAINVCSGVGFSVIDPVQEFRAVSGTCVSVEVIGGRSGDLTAFLADAGQVMGDAITNVTDQRKEML